MTILATRATPITLTQSDPTGILRREIHLRLPSGQTDVVFDGAELRFPYAALSIETEVTPDLEYQYVLRHSGGWPFSFELVSIVTDIDGSITEDVYPFNCPAVAPPEGEGAGEARRIGTDMVQFTDHTAQAQAHLIQYFTGKTRIDALLASYGTQNQTLEDTAWQVLTQRGISSAVGVQLDNLGEIVGEPRGGRDDEPYRAAIRVRVLVNRSSGHTEELITIAKRMTGLAVQVVESYPAHLTITLVGLGGALGPDVARNLRQAKAGGVGMSVLTVSDPDRSFTWDSTPTSSGSTPGAAPTTGWGSTTDAGMGGLWAGVL